MRKLLVVLMALGLCLGLTGIAVAGDTATQTVDYQVTAINELSVSGNPAAFIVNTATAGSEPDGVEEAGTTSYAITTNCATDAKKITAAIDSNMPTGLELEIGLSPPAGAETLQQTVLSTVAQDVITGIDAVASSGHDINYQLTPTVAAGVVPSSTRTVTLTLTNM